MAEPGVTQAEVIAAIGNARKSHTCPLDGFVSEQWSVEVAADAVMALFTARLDALEREREALRGLADAAVALARAEAAVVDEDEALEDKASDAKDDLVETAIAYASPLLAPPAPAGGMRDYYVHRNSGGAVFVKEAGFFEEQGGLRDDWGKHWTRVQASSIEAARSIGEATLPAPAGGA